MIRVTSPWAVVVGIATTIDRLCRHFVNPCLSHNWLEQLAGVFQKKRTVSAIFTYPRNIPTCGPIYLVNPIHPIHPHISHQGFHISQITLYISTLGPTYIRYVPINFRYHRVNLRILILMSSLIAYIHIYPVACDGVPVYTFTTMVVFARIP